MISNKIKSIIVAADLHIGTTGVKMLEYFKHDLELVHCDLLVLAGDIAESAHNATLVLDTMKDEAPQKVFIPGNHDLWKDLQGFTGYDKLNNIYPKRCEEKGYHWLEGMLIDGELAVIYTPAWHDMSLRSPMWPVNWTDRQFYDEYWENFSDGSRMNLDPRILSMDQLESFKKHLAEVPETVQALLVISHYPIFQETYTPLLPANMRGIGNPAAITKFCKLSDAFFYSPRFGEVVKKWSVSRPDVKVLSISGHTHTGFSVDVTPSIKAYNSRADYHAPTMIGAYWGPYWEGTGSNWHISEMSIDSGRFREI